MSISSATQPIRWSQHQDQLIESLTVLSQIKEKDKIYVVDEKALKIALENRWTIRRMFSGDGCERTVKIIDKIMGDSFAFAALAKEELERRMANNNEAPKQAIKASIEETSDQLFSLKCKELREMIGKAIWGIHALKNLYGSKEEGELEIAEELKKQICRHKISLLALYENDEEKPKLPDLEVPVEQPVPGISMTKAGIAITSVTALTFGTLVLCEKFSKAVQNVNAAVNRVQELSDLCQKPIYMLPYTVVQVLNVLGK